jgi:hypothetical protein
MYDVRDWLRQINPGLHNISNPHVFVLLKNVSGSVVLRYKQWSRDQGWLPEKDPTKGIEMLKHVCTVATVFTIFRLFLGRNLGITKTK